MRREATAKKSNKSAPLLAACTASLGVRDPISSRISGGVSREEGRRRESAKKEMERSLNEALVLVSRNSFYVRLNATEERGREEESISSRGITSS